MQEYISSQFDALLTKHTHKSYISLPSQNGHIYMQEVTHYRTPSLQIRRVVANVFFRPSQHQWWDITWNAGCVAII